MKTAKLISATLVIMLIMTILPLGVFAAPGNFSQTGLYNGILSYRVGNDGTVAITACSKIMSGDVEIPNAINDMPVTSIDDYSFQYRDKITSIAIPQSVTHIGYSAFYGCTSLEKINIPDSVEVIEYAAFYKCTALKTATIGDLAAWCNASLDGEYANPAAITGELIFNGKPITSVDVPKYITRIGDYAFYGCKGITSVTIPDNITYIGECAFYGCEGISNIVIPAGVTKIGGGAFSACDNLKVTIDPNNESYKSVEGTIIGIEEKAVISGAASGNIPSDGSVTKIEAFSFSGCKGLTSITIPNTVTEIGANAFKNCTDLTSVVLPNGLKRINQGLFNGCEKLTSISIPEGVVFIGISAFRDCKSLSSIQFPNTVESIKDFAFAGCSSLKGFTLPKSVEVFEDGALADCSGLVSLSVEKGNGNYYSYKNCIIESGKGRLVSGCITSVMPTDGSVTSIAPYAFSGNTQMTRMAIPAQIKEIGTNAFSGCENLKTIYYGSDELSWKKIKKNTGNEALEQVTFKYNTTDMPQVKVENLGTDGNVDGDQNATSNSWWIWILVGAAIAATAVATVFILKKKKK